MVTITIRSYIDEIIKEHKRDINYIPDLFESVIVVYACSILDVWWDKDIQLIADLDYVLIWCIGSVERESVGYS